MAGLRHFAVIVATTIAVSLTSAGAAQAKPTPLTYQQIAALPLDEQAVILDPLRALANAAGEVGRSQWASVYSGIQIDASARTVTIYLTDLRVKSAFLARCGRPTRRSTSGPPASHKVATPSRR